MDFNEYRKWQPKYAAYDKWEDKEKRKQQAILEFTGEATEVLGIIQKAQRKGEPINRERVVDELGDSLWGLVGVMNEFDISLEELIGFNVRKLTDRNTK